MKILHIATKPYNTYALDFSFIKTFKKKCEVNDILYPDKIWKDGYSIIDRVANKFITLFKIKELNLCKKIEKIDFKKYDVVIVYKGTFLKPECIDFMREKNNDLKIVCYNPDDPFNKASSNSNILESLNKYDIYFIWSKKLKRELENRNIFAYYMPFAADLELHNRNFFENLDIKYKVSFIGNWDEEREKWLSSIDNKDDLALFGNNWTYKLKTKELLKCIQGAAIGKEFVKVAQESIININILRLQNKNSNNMRTFELPASGGFCLHEYSEEVEEFFKSGEEIEFFKNSEELNDKIKFYVNNPESAKQIAKNSYNRLISSNYTYDERVNQILEVINES